LQRAAAGGAASTAIRRLSLRPVLTFGTPLQEGIDSEALAALDDAQLKELGIKRMGDRTKVLPLLFNPSNLTRVFTASSPVHGIVELTQICHSYGQKQWVSRCQPHLPARLDTGQTLSSRSKEWAMEEVETFQSICKCSNGCPLLPLRPMAHTDSGHGCARQ